MYMPLKDKTLNTINRKNHYLRLHSTKNSTSPDSSESVASALAKFFCIYDPRLMTSCDFLIWRTHNQVCLPVKDRQEEIPLFINFLRKYKHEWSEEEVNNIKKLEKNCDIGKFFQLRLVDPRAFVNWCEDEYNTTLERKKLLPNKLVGGDIKRQETFNKYMYLQTNPSKWIITHNNEPIDIGRAFARTIVWDEIKMLEYDNPTLSFIIDLTQPQKKFRHVVSCPIFEEVIRIPEHYLKKPSQSFEELFNKFYSDNKRWLYDDFGSVNDNDRLQPFYLFVRDICKHLFSLWDYKIHQEYCLEGTWGRLVMDPLLKLISNPSKDRGFWQWEGAGSLASEFRKETDPRKPDFWVLIEVDNTFQEILYEENSGGPFAYGTNLRICILDQPSPPLCRVRELFNIPIPYKLPVDRISVLYFVHNLWKVHLGFIETIEKMGNVDQIINRSRQEPTIQHVYDLPTLTIQDFTSFPTP
ncbi:hypothetical protein F8M41_015698 [Gigaspora margarita]|uniref:Uncharacterized protein n=1 Tax=Gigaspora margarita TaxID=4874 RepID=A0A8H3WTT9_GIGMA|nr:hypothetical protein F8M41_015698 [Gigaspora margarita]